MSASIAERLARALTRRPVAWAITVGTALLAAVSGPLALGVEHDDDLLAFLPERSEEVATFRAVNERFGGLDVAIVGIDAGDVFAPDHLRRLQEVTREVHALEGVAHVLSLANVEDFRPDPAGGIVTGRVVSRLPDGEEASRALREAVLARDHLRGSLVSEDGAAAVLLATLAHGANPRRVAGEIRRVARAGFGSLPLYWGGNPFIASYIFDTTQADMRRLTPWAVGAIVLLMILAFADLIGSALALVATGLGIVVAIAGMRVMGEPLNIVLGGMPVILFAVGSAYGIHMLTRFYALAEARRVSGAEPDAREDMVLALSSVGPTVLAAGGTTMVGLASFMLMDVRPIRTFGLVTALGIGVTLVLSLTFIPAVVSLSGLRGRATPTSRLARPLGALSEAARRQRLPLGVGLLLVAVAGAWWTTRVDTRMDPSSFYAEGSDPDRADVFLAERFGGSQFAQLHVRGDMSDPTVLRELRRLADGISLLEHVTGVVHLGQAVALGNEAMEGERRIPDEGAKLRTLWPFLESEPALAQLVSADRSEALVHIRLDARDASDLEASLDTIEGWIAQEAAGSTRRVEAGAEGAAEAIEAVVEARILAAAHSHDVALEASSIELALRELGAAGSTSAAVEEALARYLRGAEAMVDLPPVKDGVDVARELARAAAALPPVGEDGPESDVVLAAVKGALEAVGTAGDILEDEELVADLAWSLETPLVEARRQAGSADQAATLATALGLEGGAREVLVEELARAIQDRSVPDVIVRSEEAAGAESSDAPSPITVRVTGVPVLHRGLSRSVTRNQVRSLIFALALVFVLMVLLFRSVAAGALATAPMTLTLLVIYGVMGVADVHLDMGTSMLASIVIGAGVDYAVHLMSAWRARGRREGEDALLSASREAALHSGPAIWTNALAVSVGFAILTLGDSRPLQNVGSLTASAMLVAALATFLAVPALARRPAYLARPSLLNGD